LTVQEGEPMKEFALDDPVASLTIGELKMLIEQIIERQRSELQSKGNDQQIAMSVDRTTSQIKAIRALRGSGRGERLLERLWVARAEERAREP
jgi:hypothetical protein